MPCYHPLAAWRTRGTGHAPGRAGAISFAPQPNHRGAIALPCGRCIGCRLERSRQWAIRCVHEASLHLDNCFVTLTYDNDSLPPDASLRPSDFTLFMKRLRRASDHAIRFFQCGEYGETFHRPHHHALLFGHAFRDQELLRDGDFKLYRSQQLDSLWGHGACTVAPTADFDAAAYIARYTLKKVTGPPADEHYAGRHAEYLTMSRRPGIAAHWAHKYRSDYEPYDQLVHDGTKMKPPRFYVQQLGYFQQRRIARDRELASRNDPDSTGRRLITRERVKEAYLKMLTRRYETEQTL